MKVRANDLQDRGEKAMNLRSPMIRPYLITRDLEPENQETPIHFLHQWITPTE